MYRVAAPLCVVLSVVYLAARPAPVRANKARPAATLAIDTVQAAEQTPEPQPVLVTDASQLVAMGFPAKAQHVYIDPGVLSGVRPAAQPAAEEFGFGTGSNYTSLGAKAFTGRQNTAAAPWQYTGGQAGCCENLSRTGTEEFADAEIVLPPGVAIQSVRYWANDSNAVDDMFFTIIQSCQPTASAGANTNTVIAQGQTSGADGYQGGLLAGGVVTANTRDCTYIARVRFAATASLTFQKLRVEWRRQVSPSPFVSTFLDVPVNHFYFKWIEALAANGITSGCAPGPLYCPDAPVTRAQMAVFIAVALGLQR